MKNKHKSCKATTRSGRKCSRLGHCEKENMCTQHHNMSKEHSSLKHNSPKNIKSDELISKIYYTIDDGGRPFKVEIKNFGNPLVNEVSVYKQNSEDFTIYDNDPLVTYKAEKVFVGKDPQDKSLDGNSILVEIDSKKLKYLHIGATVFSFTAYSRIIDYVSIAENSAWPYAIDKMGNCYLMVEDAILIINEELKKILQDKSNPNPYHEYYYKYWYIRDIYIGNEERNLNYTSKDFDTFKKDITRYIPNGSNLEIYYMNKDGKKELLTKEKYKNFMDKKAKKNGFKPYLDKHIFCKSINDTNF
jgi:hypothetical protein